MPTPDTAQRSRRASLPPTDPRGVIEAKFGYNAAEHSLILAGLRATCIPDPRFPHNTVFSLYYDTPRRQHLADKLNSDFMKTKVRLRWYGAANPAPTVEAHVEVKAKEGVRRTKRRVPVDFPAGCALHSPHALFTAAYSFAHVACTAGYRGPRPLIPMLLIRYERHRFVESVQQARIALDRRITCLAINDTFFAPLARTVELPVGVLEVKSATGELPDSFRSFRNRLFHRDSFSKYEECWRVSARPLHRHDFRWMHFAR